SPPWKCAGVRRERWGAFHGGRGGRPPGWPGGGSSGQLERTSDTPCACTHIIGRVNLFGRGMVPLERDTLPLKTLQSTRTGGQRRRIAPIVRTISFTSSQTDAWST